MTTSPPNRRDLRTVGPVRLVLVLLFAAPAGLLAQHFAETRQAPAAPASGRVVQETWEAAYLEGVKAGYVHYVVRELQPGDQKIVRASQELNLSVRRFGQIAVIRAVIGTDETTDGKVVGVFMRQGLARQQNLELVGTVQDGILKVRVSGQANNERRIRWSDRVLSMRAEQDYLKDHRLKPGDTFSYQLFEPTVNALVTIRGTVFPPEVVPELGGRKCLRVEVKPDKIQTVQLPTAIHWVDPKSYVRLRSQTELPGLGKLTTMPTNRAAATAPVAAPERLVDMGLGQSIRLGRRLPVRELAAVTYRVRMPKDDEPSTAFAQDDCQQVSDVDAPSHAFTLRVQEQRRPSAEAGQGGSPGKEFTSSNFYITSADPEVRRLAGLAVGTETDDWRKSLKIERWVRANMRAVTFSEAMATADHVARTLEGDCTEYAMLAAAMCRAVGVPSRTALGLVYFERGGEGWLAYHMWTEVYVRGQWLGIDATLGQGGVDPSHLKITDHSWYDTRSLLPLLPVLRVLSGRPEIKVIGIERRRPR